MGIHTCLPGKEEEDSQDPLARMKGDCPHLFTGQGRALCFLQLELSLWGPLCKGLVGGQYVIPGMLERFGLEGGDSLSELACVPL